ncbi:MAG: PQQ-dependent sugar dehydrogenase [Planctomycetes bacterium]|nr:PQQ-dependent sugar dehydrogenase [Planctomycetota bacterium]
MLSLRSPKVLFALVAACAATLGAPRAAAQSTNGSALRFHALGNGQDRARFPIDDDGPGPDASAPGDVGTQDFTLELWLRGTNANNPSAAELEGSYADDRWHAGTVLLDRTLAGGGGRAYALSLRAGRVAFFTGEGDPASSDAMDTSIGDRDVLDGAWHHVAVTRDATSGVKRIYVDGGLDYQSPPLTSRADLSYPNAGLGGGAPWDPWLVLGASKDDAHAAFRGEVDELRLWSVARAPQDVAGAVFRRMLPLTVGLASEWRLEEGYGTVLADTSGRNAPPGTLVSGQPGNGEWVDVLLEPTAVAPISTSLPAGFVKELLFPVHALVALEFGPDGRLYAADRTGKLLSWAGSGPSQLVLTIATEFAGERGLLGIAFDPAFLVNGHVYVFYTTPQARSRVSRFTIVNGVASPASEFVVWENSTPCDLSHQSGALHFGSDGKLYIAAGDQYVSANSQNGANLDGKILRLSSDGSIPSDNPFVGSPSVRPEIWALGLRNPFRFRVDAPTGRIWVGDVGGNGADAWEELNLLARGANYGWPLAEGPVCHAPDCSPFTTSRFHYRHDDVAHTGGYPQAAIIAGPVYRGATFPPEYVGRLFVADFAVGWLSSLELDAAGQVVAEHPFALAPEFTAVSDLDVGPDGALYLALHHPGEVWRVRWAGSANAPPLSRASAAPTLGPAPLAVQFTGSTSLDLDQGPQPLSFHWDFGDGASSTAPDPQHVYTTRGRFEARLDVHDGVETSSATTLVEVGTRPVITRFSPPAQAAYGAGETIPFTCAATDLEDGPLHPIAFTWRVILVHEGHEHPFLGPLTGVSGGSFAIPVSGHGPEHTHFEIELEVRDSDGLVVTERHALAPRVAPFELRSQPPGITLALDGEPTTTPLVYDSLDGFQHAIEAPETATIAGQPWVFDHWSTGETARSIALTMVAAGDRLKAFYRPEDRTTMSIAVPAVDRNVEWRAPSGQSASNPFDPTAVCFGTDTFAIEAGFEFALPLPRGAVVESARLEFVGASDSAGFPLALVQAFAVGDAPPFVAGSAIPPTAHAPLLGASLAWIPPPFHEDDVYASPDLAALLQPILLRSDWNPGQHVGLVVSAPLAPSGAWRCVRNVSSGQPARLVLTWRPDPGQGVLPPRRR